MTGTADLGSQMAAPKIARKDLEDLLRREFPEMFALTSGLAIEELWYGGCRLRREFDANLLRPGGTIGGTTLMALADYAMYFAVLSAIGWVPLAVTTNLTMNFLSKPGARHLIAEARLLKLGKRLAVGEIGIRSAGEGPLVAHATSTYSIPAK